MEMSMKKSLALLALCCVLFAASVIAEPEPVAKPEAAKGARRSAYFNEPAHAKFRSALPEEHLVAELRQAAAVDDAAEDDAEEEVAEINGSTAQKAGDPSSGRLFLKKFLLFKNIFGSSSQQPVIPIILTGGTGTGTTNPTTTITSTGTIPTATGTITTSPTTRVRATDADEGESAAAEAAEELAAMNEEALQAALAAGAQEYVVTDEEIKGTASDSKATKPSANRINLKRKNGRKGQVISVRIPPKYRRYFKNGQKVMLNTGNNNNNGKRRVVRKRVNQVRRKNKNGKNKNRRRIMNA